jgi:hypothetical protein
MNADLRSICTRRAALLRELADLDLALVGAVEDQERPTLAEPDVVLSLEEAAAFMGEPASTFRRRPEYLKALISRPGERRKRYSRVELERIKADRLAANGVKAMTAQATR